MKSRNIFLSQASAPNLVKTNLIAHLALTVGVIVLHWWFFLPYSHLWWYW